MINGAFSLLEAAAKFEAFKLNMNHAAEGILSEWAVMVRDRAKESIGTYRYGWTPLGPAAVAKHGDTPLLDTGALRVMLTLRKTAPHLSEAMQYSLPFSFVELLREKMRRTS